MEQGRSQKFVDSWKPCKGLQLVLARWQHSLWTFLSLLLTRYIAEICKEILFIFLFTRPPRHVCRKISAGVNGGLIADLGPGTQSAPAREKNLATIDINNNLNWKTQWPSLPDMSGKSRVTVINTHNTGFICPWPTHILFFSQNTLRSIQKKISFAFILLLVSHLCIQDDVVCSLMSLP